MEATGLLKPSNAPLDQQPEVIEFAAVRLDDATLEETAHLCFLVRPTLLWPLPAEVTEITGITTEMLADQPTWAGRSRAAAEFALGERLWAAHNAGYDLGVLECEQRRIGAVARFPWPIDAVCTVELTMDLPAPRARSDRLKLGELYAHLTGEAQGEAHRALADARTLAECVRRLRALDGRI